jgi:hypothetical protein
MRRVVLTGYGGGLGDWLQYSTIPELCSQNGIECFVWWGAPFRNEQTRDLFLKNPYLIGMSNFDPNAGSLIYKGWDSELDNIIKIQEKNHGFEPQNDLPIIYYKPKFHREFMGKTLIDFNSIATNNMYDDVKVQSYLDSLDNNKVILLNNTKYKLNGKINLFTSDIYHYTDVLYSCDKFVGFHSGGASLVGAISRMRADLECDVFIPDDFDIVKDIGAHVFIYKNQNYIKF